MSRGHGCWLGQYTVVSGVRRWWDSKVDGTTKDLKEYANVTGER